MTTVLTRPAATLKTTGGDLKKLMNAVLAHVNDSEEDAHPIFAKLHVEVRDGSLRLVCSDRFTLGLAIQRLDVTSEGFTVSLAIPADEIRVALEYLDETSPVTFTVQGDAVRIKGNVDAEIPGVASKLPWRDVLSKFLRPQATPTATLGLDPAYLARFAAAKPLAPSAPLVARFAGEKGMTVLTLGTVFLGMIAPIDLGAALQNGTTPERPLDVWFDLLDEDPVPSA